MSVKLMSAIFDSRTLGPTERLIMLALADHADDDGKCYPSIPRLCQRTGLGERAMQGNLKKLQAAGYLSVSAGGGRGRSNLYTVNINPARNAPISEENPAQETPFLVQNPAFHSENPASGALNPARNAPEPSRTIIEPSEDTPLVPQTFNAPPKKPPRRACQIPDGWVPSERNITDALSKNFTEEETNEQADAFRDYHLSKGSVFKDWDAAWRTWLGNARKFGRASQARHPGNRSAHDGLFASFQRAALRN